MLHLTANPVATLDMKAQKRAVRSDERRSAVEMNEAEGHAGQSREVVLKRLDRLFTDRRQPQAKRIAIGHERLPPHRSSEAFSALPSVPSTQGKIIDWPKSQTQTDASSRFPRPPIRSQKGVSFRARTAYADDGATPVRDPARKPMSDETPSVAEARPCRNAALGKASREVSYGRCRHDLFVRTAFDPTSENAAPRQSRSPSEACALGEGSLRPASPKGSLSPIASAKSSSAQAGTLPKRQREQTARPRTAPPPGTQPKHVNETLKNAKGRGARKNPCKASCRHRLLALLSRASPFPFSRPRPALASACARTRSDIARNAVAHERSRGASCKTRAGRSAFAGGIGVFG